MNLAYIPQEFERLTPTDVGNKLYGENFTPRVLIEEILSNFPQEIFRDPGLRWLDPCAGLGNFPVAIYSRLFAGLQEVIPDERERKHHIISKMIFMVDIQRPSTAYARKLFGKDANIITRDFLGGALPESWGSHFDVIVGNPPYERIVDGGRSAKNDNLWSKFIDRSYGLVADGGILCFITPPAWMSPASKQLKEVFLKSTFLYLDIQGCAKHFRVGSKFCYFVLNKIGGSGSNPVRVSVDFKGSKSVRPELFSGLVRIPKAATFIPQLLTPQALRILEKTSFDNGPKFPVSYDSDLHRYTKRDLLSVRKSGRHKFKVIHTPRQTLWSIRPHKNHGLVKVFIPLTTNYEQILIDDCGNTQGVGYIICDSEGEAQRVRKVLLSAPFRFIAGITRWSNFNVPGVMKSLPHVDTRGIPLHAITDKWVCEKLGLDDEEVKYLAEMVKDSFRRDALPSEAPHSK